MPYIKNVAIVSKADMNPMGRRSDLAGVSATAKDAGELNFQITRLFIDYIGAHGLNYQYINDCVGAGLSAVAEFQRRVVAPYEDTKIAENGDVYPEHFLSPNQIRDNRDRMRR
jgi:hypothetical protein